MSKKKASSSLGMLGYEESRLHPDIRRQSCSYPADQEMDKAMFPNIEISHEDATSLNAI